MIFSDSEFESLKVFFNQRPRNIIVSTSSKNGEINSAILNSSRIVDNNYVEFDIGNSVTLENLKENKNATLLIARDGKSLMEYKGVRIYTKVSEIQHEGIKLEKARELLAKIVSKEAAAGIVATVILEIIKIRPLVDRGQIWSKSV